jgi:hypothetical protein
MPTELKIDMHSSWFRVGLRLYERMVLTPMFCGFDVSYALFYIGPATYIPASMRHREDSGWRW